MYNYFENQLKEKAELQSSNDLWVQWETAKKTAPNALSMITNVFPHFSLHDISHSESILDKIERILGKDQIKDLSATDLWMMLFVSYFHDIGMFVSKDDIVELIDNEEFLKFVKESQEDEKCDSHKYANCFEIEKKSIYYKHEKISVESYNALRFLFATYLRNEHAKRSKTKILDYKKTSSFIYIPESIPSRIIDLIAEICCCHCESFEKVMLLKQEQTGVFGDNCHPRFIACMLRLGDVLDIDNNRFSPVVLSTLPSIPKESLKHLKKHLAIKELLISQTEISVKAKCDEIDIGELTTSWFNWISNEVSLQSKNWQQIIPSHSFKSLPMIKNLDVEIEGYDVVNGNKRPQFSFGVDKALSLIQGTGLYDSKFVFVREILQNAVDATLLKIFVDNEKEINGDINNFRKIAKDTKYKITFSLKTKPDNRLIILVRDNGIGIDTEDFKYLLSSGNEGKNPKKEILKKMPEWMKPSGVFGIGLHSIFSITDEFTINTTKRNSGLDIEGKLFSPTSEKKGAVYLKTKKSKINSQVGTTIKFEYKSNPFPSNLSLSGLVYEEFRNFDFVSNPNVNFELAQIIDEVTRFSDYCYVPIILEINEEKHNLFNEKATFKFFDENNSLEYNIYKPGYISRVYYRNQLLEKCSLDKKYFSLEVNLLCGDAKDKLYLSRSDLKTDYKLEFDELLENSLKKFFLENFNNLDKDLQPFVGMYLESTIGEEVKEETPWRKSWENFNYKLSGANKKLSEIINLDSISFKLFQNQNIKEANSIKNKKAIIVQDFYNTPIIEFLKSYLLRTGYKTTWKVENGKDVQILEYTKSPSRFIDNYKDFADKILIYSHMARCLIPCETKYKSLALSQKYIENIGYTNILPYGCYYTGISLMALPYIVKKEDNYYVGKIEEKADDIFYETIFQNRADNNISKEEIIKTYKTFIEEWDKAMKIKAKGRKNKTKTNSKKE